MGSTGRATWRQRHVATVAAVLLAGLAVLALLATTRAWDHDRGESAHTHGTGATDATQGTPARHTGPQGRVGQFVVKCAYSHSADDDPIVHPSAPGRSHRHDFFGATDTDSSSTASDLLDSDTTCDKSPDTAAYWHPTLYDFGRPVEPVHLHAYYRAAPEVDPARVEPYPLGLELIAGDPTATSPVAGEAAGWVCGSSTRLHAEPPSCPDSAPLHLLLTFPDCWDGEHVRSDDHRSHAAYSDAGDCPDTHQVHVPQLTVSVKFPITGAGHELTLASGSVYSAHGDFLNAWDRAGLAREIDNCIRRDVVCDLASNREEEGPFFHN